MQKPLFALFAIAISITLQSCNTFIGASRDIQRFGTGLENKAHGKTWNGQTQAKPLLAPPAQ